jgi:hypothetical protein
VRRANLRRSQGEGVRLIRIHRDEEPVGGTVITLPTAQVVDAAREVANALRAASVDATWPSTRVAALALLKAVGDAGMAVSALNMLGIPAPGGGSWTPTSSGAWCEVSRDAFFCAGPWHQGDRYLATRYDAFERRIEFRRMSDRGREAVVLDRLVCRSCMRAEVQERRADGQPGTLPLLRDG